MKIGPKRGGGESLHKVNFMPHFLYYEFMRFKQIKTLTLRCYGWLPLQGGVGMTKTRAFSCLVPLKQFWS